MTDSSRIQYLLIPYIEGTLGDHERIMVERWIEANSNNRAIFEQMLCICRDTVALDTYAKVDTEAALKRVKKHLHSHSRSIWSVITKVAALLFLPLSVTFVWLALQKANEQPAIMELQAVQGTIGRVMLPDSSTVVLNSGSKLRYPAVFSRDSRNVELCGEAYFDVAKDNKRRFTINIPAHGTVTVYGTSFNIEAYEDEDFSITLDSGNITFSPETSPGNEYRLLPGQQLTHTHDGHIEIDKSDDKNVSSWTCNKIIIDHTPLRDILKRLSRKYQVNFEIEKPQMLDNTYSGGSISMTSLEYVLETLEISSGIRWQYVTAPDKNDQTTILIY